MKTLSIALALLLSTNLAFSQAVARTQNPTAIKEVAEDFLKQQVAGLSERTVVTTNNVDPRLTLAECANLTPFLPPGSRVWGKITVGIRCTAPSPWTIYLSANVQVFGEYYVAASAIGQGHVITEADLAKVTGELSNLPSGTITNPDQAVGRISPFTLLAGSVLRADTLKSVPVVQQGQSVKLIASGNGFSISTDAMALTNATEGQMVRARTNSGQLVSGTAKAGGIIEIKY
jgi:flagella basal body P-ring formation protein FlgA